VVDRCAEATAVNGELVPAGAVGFAEATGANWQRDRAISRTDGPKICKTHPNE